MPDETGILHQCDAPEIVADASKSTVPEVYFESDGAGSVFMSDETGTHILCQCDVPDTSVTTPKSTLPVTDTKSTEVSVSRFYLGSGEISKLKHGKEKGDQSLHMPIKKLIAQTADATVCKRGKRIQDGKMDTVRKSGRQPIKTKNTDFINY